jgi:hypothetical protein
MLLWENRPGENPANSNRSDTPHSPVYATEVNSSQTVELIMVQVSNQPFGLLLKQIYNIARPEGDLFSVISPPEPAEGREWAEILYQGKPLRVLELARKLQLAPVEALNTSKILLSGRLVPGGNIQQPFGVSVDDIIGVWPVELDKIRLLDEWVCRKRLGRLLWGVALLEREAFGSQYPNSLLNRVELQPALTFSGIIREPGFLPGSEWLAAENKPGRTESASQEISDLEDIRRFKNNLSATLPVMLLDLEVLRAALYRY